MTAQQAAERQAAHDNLVHELVGALEAIDLAFIDDSTVDADSATGKAILAAREVLAKARGEQR